MNDWVKKIKEGYYYLSFRLKKKKLVKQTTTRELSFERDPDGSWYVILPEWQGGRGALQMVAGADDLLTLLAHGKKLITIELSNDDEMWNKWRRKQTTYHCSATDNMGNYYESVTDMSLWLCGVATFVMGYYPEHIYFIVIYDK